MMAARHFPGSASTRGTRSGAKRYTTAKAAWATTRTEDTYHRVVAGNQEKPHSRPSPCGAETVHSCGAVVESGAEARKGRATAPGSDVFPIRTCRCRC